MTTSRVASSPRRRIVLFGGQGASCLYSTRALYKIRESTCSSKTALSLLSRCHAAFLDELQSLDQSTQDQLAIDPSDFRSPIDLLGPNASLQNHALVQMVVLVLAQFLQYAAQTDRCPEGFDAHLEDVLEMNGFCSGLLTAAVVASSRNKAVFSLFAVEAFRLAFWLGCRSFLKSRNIQPTPSDGSTWSLVIIGNNAESVQQDLQYYKSVNPQCRLCLSAIFSETVVSITGPAGELAEFKNTIAAPMTKFSNVQSWYHGGDNLKNVVDQVLKDQKTRQIDFPNLRDLIVPLRSSRTGLLIQQDSTDILSLSETIIENILLHPVDWVSTSTNVVNFISSRQREIEAWPCEIQSFGPSSDSLFADMKAQISDRNVVFTDLSAFKAGDDAEAGRDDIAIIGMGVKFPKGNSEAELWETLSQGLNAVSEVCHQNMALSNPLKFN